MHTDTHGQMNERTNKWERKKKRNAKSPFYYFVPQTKNQIKRKWTWNFSWTKRLNELHTILVINYSLRLNFCECMFKWTHWAMFAAKTQLPIKTTVNRSVCIFKYRLVNQWHDIVSLLILFKCFQFNDCICSESKNLAYIAPILFTVTSRQSSHNMSNWNRSQSHF